MRIAYGKLGRSIPLTLGDASNVGGDIEVVRLLDALLERGHEVHLVGRNRGIMGSNAIYELPGVDGRGPLINQWSTGGVFNDPPPMSREYDDVFKTYDAFFHENARRLPEFDAWLIWLGQHGSSLHPVPAVQRGKTGYTNPLMSDVNYGYPVVAILNELDVQPIWLCPDPRNMVKFRDLWNPKQRMILAQFNTSKDNTFFDERDQRIRKGSTHYEYSGIELLAAPPLEAGDRPPLVPPAQSFGLLVNEGYNNLKDRGRLHLVQTWCKNIEYEIFGTWSDSSQSALGRKIGSVALNDVTSTLRRWRATMTFPATATGWATAKPWECFKAGTICFRHPGYDTQNRIYNQSLMGDDLYKFLSPPTVAGLQSRLEQLYDNGTWRDYVNAQYNYFCDSHERLEGGVKHVFKAIEEFKK